MKQHWWTISIASALGLLVFMYLSYSHDGSLPAPKSQFDDYLFSLLTGALTGLIFFYTTRLLIRWFHWKQKMALRLLIGFLFQSSLIIGLLLLILWVITWFTAVTDSVLFGGTFGDIHLKLIIISCFLVFLAEIVNLAFYSFNYYSNLQIEEEQQKRRQLELQFEALKSQLSPHYLFNSLNTISSLLYRDSILAEKFIRDLSAMYHFVLRTHRRNLISLKEEMDLVNSYAALMTARFGQAFKISSSIKINDKHFMIPPLSIQMLIENALKHNQFSEENPLEIQLQTKENNYLEVTNPFRPKPGHLTIDNKLLRAPTPSNSMKIGLENIKKRFSFFTHQDVSITCSRNFTVILPLIKKDDEA